jgi:hypothetical protein
MSYPIHGARSLRPSARQQLTLFVSGVEAASLESIRQRLDPVQFRLIPAHVTLCREDELATRFGTDAVPLRQLAQHAPLELHFGPPEVFDGHGVQLPCIEGESAFHALRAAILGSSNIRVPRAHITLAHPRNPRARENVPSTYASLVGTRPITLSRLALIEQRGQGPWQVLDEMALVDGE